MVYSVFEPPARNGDTVDHAVRIAFVRDGFSWGAFLFGPLWMLRYRLWSVLVVYAGLVGAIIATFCYFAVAADVELAIVLLLALLLGFEGSTLRRWTLRRRGWHDLGIVVANDLEVAERHFFDRWAAEIERRSQPLSLRPLAGRSQSAPDVIGLFPGPGASR